MTDCDIHSSSQTSPVALISLFRSHGGSVRKGAAQGRVGLLYFHVFPLVPCPVSGCFSAFTLDGSICATHKNNPASFSGGASLRSPVAPVRLTGLKVLPAGILMPHTQKRAHTHTHTSTWGVCKVHIYERLSPTCVLLAGFRRLHGRQPVCSKVKQSFSVSDTDERK